MKQGRQVAFERSSAATPPVGEVEAAGPTAVIMPFASKTITWSASIRPDRTSTSLPQRTAPGAAKANGAAKAIKITNESTSRILRINSPQFLWSDASLAAYIQT